MKLNKNELTIGLVVGGLSVVKTGWFSVPIALACSFMWAYTGAGASKLCRRLGVPSLIAGATALAKDNPVALLSILPAFAVLSMGYGIPTTKPYDEGSWLGRICYKLSNSNEDLAEFYCRSALYVLLAISFIPCFLAN